MKLPEYKGKEIFAKYGIPTPKGIVVSNAEQLKEFNFPCVLKAQVLVGGRGKAGGIKFADNLEEAKQKIKEILAMEIKGEKVKEVLVSEKLDISKEYYLSIALDRKEKLPLIIFSEEGGINIEEVEEEKIFKIWINPLIGISDFAIRNLLSKIKIGKEEGKQLADIIKKLYSLFEKEDCELAEINPLVLTRDNKFIAIDSKVIIDSDAIFRHKEYSAIEEELTPLEKKAKEKDIAFVQMDGDIGVIANGAGLTMATLDALTVFGGKGKVFLDIGGGADEEKVKDCILLMKQANPKVILLNIFGGITRCDVVALGIKEVLQKEGINIPIVARIKGSKEEEGRTILKDAGFYSAETLEEVVKKAVELSKN